MTPRSTLPVAHRLLATALVALGAAASAASATPTASAAQDAKPAAEARAQAADAAPAPESALDPALEADLAILARLDVPFAEPVAFDDAPVGEVLERVQKETGVRLLPDRNVLAEGGGWKLKTVTAVVPTPRAALDAVVRSVGEGLDSVRLDVASGVLVLTDHGGLRSLRATRSYRVGDIIRAITPVEANPDREQGVVGLDDGVSAPNAALLDVVFELIEPDIWVWSGGDLANASLVGESLIVQATPTVHQKVARLLAEFRTATPTDPLLWTFTLVELPADVTPDDERDLVGRAGSGAGGRPAGAKIISQPTILSRPTEVAKISIGDDEERWDVSVHPSCEEGRCTYAIEVECRTGAGADARSTRVTLHTAVGAPTALAFSIAAEARAEKATTGAGTRRFLLEVQSRRQRPSADSAP